MMGIDRVAALTPKPAPKVRHATVATPISPFPATFPVVLVAAISSRPSVPRRCSGVRAPRSFAGTFARRCLGWMTSGGRREVLFRIRPGNESSRLAGISSPLTDSNRRPPPYHRATRQERRASAGSRGHEDPASGRNRRKRSSRAWTRVPELMFPQCSLGFADDRGRCGNRAASSTAAKSAKSCKPEGPQDLTQRLSHLRLAAVK